MKNNMGFREIEHTADREIEVWAPSIEDLFIQGAKGMIAVMKIVPDHSPIQTRQFTIGSDEREVLLVGFLSEIAALIELKKIVPVNYDLHFDHAGLIAKLECLPIATIGKEIKAVTYYHMKIEHNGSLWRTNIVFDV